MEETQEKLEKEIGTKEIITLKPAKVKIVQVSLTPVKFGNKTNEKVVFSVKHPDKEELINISSAKILQKDKVKTTGIWFTTDEDGNIQKGSALAEIMTFAGVKKVLEMKDKEYPTTLDDNGYLCFKFY